MRNRLLSSSSIQGLSPTFIVLVAVFHLTGFAVSNALPKHGAFFVFSENLGKFFHILFNRHMRIDPIAVGNFALQAFNTFPITIR